MYATLPTSGATPCGERVGSAKCDVPTARVLPTSGAAPCGERVGSAVSGAPHALFDRVGAVFYRVGSAWGVDLRR